MDSERREPELLTPFLMRWLFRLEPVWAVLMLWDAQERADKRAMALVALHIVINVYWDRAFAVPQPTGQRVIALLKSAFWISVFYGLFLVATADFTRTFKGQLVLDEYKVGLWLRYVLLLGGFLFAVRLAVFVVAQTLDTLFRKRGAPDPQFLDARLWVLAATAVVLAFSCLYPPRKWADDVRPNYLDRPPRGFIFHPVVPVKDWVTPHLYSARTAQTDYVALAQEAGAILVGGAVLWGLAALARGRSQSAKVA